MRVVPTGYLNVSTRRSGSHYPASNNSDSPNGASTTSTHIEIFKTPTLLLMPYPQIETLRRVQAMEFLCTYFLRIDLLPGRPEALPPPLLAGVDGLPSSPTSMSNGVDPEIEREVCHFAATRLPPHVFIQPYPASHSLAPPQRAFSCHIQGFSIVLGTLLTLLGYSDTSMRATEDLLPSSMPRNAASSSTAIPISVLGDVQAVPVQLPASGQEYSYNSQVVPSTMNEPPTVTTRNSPTNVATDQSSDITARYSPPNLGHGHYTPTTSTQPQSYAVEKSPPDSDSDYFPPFVAVGLDQFRSHNGENIPPVDDYTYTHLFDSAMFSQSQNINTGDSLPYEDEMDPMPPSAEAFPSNIDP
jgi:hypothetical protein